MPPRPSTRAGSDESKRRILDATLDLARELGYEGTTIAKVSKRSGLPAGSVYWHFESKDSLFEALIDDSFARWKAEYIENHPGPEPVEPRSIAAMLTDGLDEHAAAQGFWRIGLGLALERRMQDSAARRRFLAIREEMIAFLTERWGEQLPPELLESDPTASERIARFSMASADGFFISVTAAEPIDPQASAAVLDRAIHSYIDSLVAEHGALHAVT